MFDASMLRPLFEEDLRLHLGALAEERDGLQEEVRQLRAAVQIYSEIVRRLEVTHGRRAS